MKDFKLALAKAKTYANVSDIIGGVSGGEEVLGEIRQAISSRRDPLVSESPSAEKIPIERAPPREASVSESAELLQSESGAQSLVLV